MGFGVPSTEASIDTLDFGPCPSQEIETLQFSVVTRANEKFTSRIVRSILPLIRYQASLTTAVLPLPFRPVIKEMSL